MTLSKVFSSLRPARAGASEWRAALTASRSVESCEPESDVMFAPCFLAVSRRPPRARAKGDAALHGVEGRAVGRGVGRRFLRRLRIGGILAKLKRPGPNLEGEVDAPQSVEAARAQAPRLERLYLLATGERRVRGEDKHAARLQHGALGASAAPTWH